MTEQTQRAAVIAEARAWLRTPWHHAARVRGAGVDCGMLLAEVYAAAGVIAPLSAFEHYSPDWMLHRSEERYLAELLRYCRPVEAPVPGDIALFRFGRTASHAGIVIDWPIIIHAFRQEGGVVISHAEQGRLIGRLVGYYSPWPVEVAS